MKHLLFPLADMQVSLWLLVARRRGCDRAAILRSAKESERGHWGYSWPYRLVGSACLCYEKFIVHFTNMVESIKQKLYYSLYTVAAFVITRYPYVCAVLLMLSTGEEFNTGVRKVNSGRFSMIYAHLGMYFLAGTAMSFDLFGTKRLFALISATQMGLSSYQDYVTSGLKESVMMRHLSRNVAIIGCYLMVAGGISDFQRGVDRNRRFLAFGRQMLGAFSILNAFMIWNSHDELRAHIVHIPGGKIVSYVFVVIYVLCGVTLYGGYESAFFSKLLAWLLTVVTVLVDMDTKFWWNTAHVRYFMEMTIASRSLCIIGTLILIRGNV